MGPTPPTFRHERAARRRGAWLIAGVDEAGRGPLAGPVVAAAVTFDGHRAPRGIADSKTLPPEERERLFAAILASAGVAVAAVSPAEIDRVNIRQASLLAMARAVAGLARPPDHLLVDGRDCPDCACPAEAVIGGDGACLSVAAASIVAKVARDRLMVRLARAHPGYGFEAHKGYATAAHLAALARLGPCVAHRRSFAPVRRDALDPAV